MHNECHTNKTSCHACTCMCSYVASDARDTYMYIQCYQGRKYILYVTFLHVRCTNLHENQPDLECSHLLQVGIN